MAPRLATDMLVSLLLRRCQQQGGFGTVIHRGDAQAGAILIQCRDGAESGAILERWTDFDGRDSWRVAGPTPGTATTGPKISGSAPDSADAPSESPENQYIVNRRQSDRDMWVIELDIADAERFAAETIAIG